MSNRAAHRSPSRLSTLVVSAPWIVVALGAAVMVVLLVLAVGASCQAPRPVGGLPAPEPMLLPGSPASSPLLPASEPGGPTPGTESADTPEATRTTRTARATRSAPPPVLLSTPPPGPTETPAVPPEVTGHYRVLNSYHDSFIAEVSITSTSARSRPWVVGLAFPPQVRAVRSAWVESAPRPVVSRVGDAYVFTGVVPVEPGQTVALRVHFERSGTADQPTYCLVNATACG